MSPTQHIQQNAQPRARGMFTGRVLINDFVCSEHYRIRISLANFPPSRPGQFINIQCGPDRSNDIGVIEWPEGRMPHLSQAETDGRVPLLRRPFSLAWRTDASDGSAELDIFYSVVGAGSNWIFERKIGDDVNVLGPLGKGFTIRDDKSLSVIIGGGTGIGPMIYLLQALAMAGKQTALFAGLKSAPSLPKEKGDGTLWNVATSFIPEDYFNRFKKGFVPLFYDIIDGSQKQDGMVHQAFDRWLNREKPAPANMVVYTCGSEPMMKAVAEICLAAGIECQLAMERYMACGMGVCQGCAIKVKTDAPPGWKFKLVCKDGPVFDANELLWE